MKRMCCSLALSLFALSVGARASHAQIVLDFEKINAAYPDKPTPLTSINNFYNGGTSSVGTSGVNYGVTFSSNAFGLCLNGLGMTQTHCSVSSRGGQGDPTSQQGGLGFDHAGAAYINMAAGFQTGFSFFYSAYSPFSVNVWDGLNGTGSLLGTLALPVYAQGCANYGAVFCPLISAGVAFAGTAKSVSFTGINDEKVFDDVTFGSLTAGRQVVPEPSTVAMTFAGLALVGLMRRRATAKS